MHNWYVQIKIQCLQLDIPPPSQLLHSHFVSGSEIPKVKVKTRGQKIQNQHNEMIDERSNVE